MLITGSIFAATLFLLLRKPWNIHESWATMGGAALMLLFGCLTFEQATTTVAAGADVLIFLFALLLLSSLLDRAGFFEWCALHAARAANGNGKRLYINVFIIGAIITAFLSLDTTAIILTPIVVSFVHRLRLNELPFVIACAFISNTGSLLLPVSNLTNLLFQDAFAMSFLDFSTHMLLPQLVAIAVNYGLFLYIFRNEIQDTFDSSLPEPDSAIKNQTFFKVCLLVLTLVIIGYFAGALIKIPPYVIALGGCSILIVPALVLKCAKWSELAHDISWELFPFVIGLFIEVRALENLGLTQLLANFLTQFNHHPLEQLLSTAFSTALGSNIVNNVPMALLSISVIKQLPHADISTQCAALIGCNIGPNLTVAGSLATMLVMTAARKRGVAVTAWQFFRIGAFVTPFVILASTLALCFQIH